MSSVKVVCTSASLGEAYVRFLEYDRPVYERSNRYIQVLRICLPEDGESTSRNPWVVLHMPKLWYGLRLLQSLLPLREVWRVSCGSEWHRDLFPILVHSQKNIGTEYCPRRHRSGLHNLGKLLALGRRQTYPVLLDRHIRIVLSWTQQSYENICFYTIFNVSSMNYN